MTLFRYPGGKSKLVPDLLPRFHITRKMTYFELFLGGGSTGLAVAREYPDIDLVFNDLNQNMFSFWSIVACGTDADFQALLGRVAACVVTMELFLSMRATEPAGTLDRAFRALFFNRTTYGGCGNGPMGGKNQDGTWRIYDRWDAESLVSQMTEARNLLRGRTIVTGDDFSETIKLAARRESFTYADPPYYLKSAKNNLYHIPWKHEDHVRLRDCMRGLDNWVMSYDNHPAIAELYDGFAHREVLTETDYSLRAGNRSVCEAVIMSPSAYSEYLKRGDDFYSRLTEMLETEQIGV
jgi:DNA adenine methylase